MKKRIPPKFKHQEKKSEKIAKPAPQRKGKYWEDPVYRHLSFLRRNAETVHNISEMQRLSELMQQVIDNRMTQDVYEHLLMNHRVFKQQVKKQRKQQQRIPEKTERTPINVNALKRVIFNYQASIEKVIKAFEALPEEERKRLTEKLPPFLKRRLEPYLKQKGYL